MVIFNNLCGKQEISDQEPLTNESRLVCSDKLGEDQFQSIGDEFRNHFIKHIATRYWPLVLHLSGLFFLRDQS